MNTEHEKIMATLVKKKSLEHFTAPDAQSNMLNMTFRCLNCDQELVEKIFRSDEGDINIKTLLKGLEDIIKLLKEIDKFDIQALDYFHIVEMKKRKNKGIKDQGIVQEKPEYIVKKVKEPEKDLYLGFENVEIEVACQQPQKLKKDNTTKIKVNGQINNLSDITEDDIELMSENEYEIYFEILNKNNEAIKFNNFLYFIYNSIS
jgi:hypothetical protein